MNRRYWEDEFLQGVDSDYVIIFQADVVLCYPLDVEEWKQYAYVGGVWPKTSSPLFPEPMEGSCLGMPNRWRNWLMPQNRWEMQQKKGFDMTGKHVAPKPRELLPSEFPEVCKDGMGPIGNGGFSMRSRSWMIKVIELCPHVGNSGLDLEHMPLACKVFERVNEDFYFGTVLRGIRAPLPFAYQASLFSAEILWPEQVVELYGVEESSKGRDLRGTVVGKKPYVWIDGKKLTIPNGLHKPWWYNPNDLLQSTQLSKACPFLEYIFHPSMSRWDEVNPEKPQAKWVGIGH